MSKVGTLFVISGPSAVGKSTVIERVLQLMPSLTRVVTCTTRAPRTGEVAGRDYIFLSKEDFLQRTQRNEFVEFSEVYGNYYGILLSKIRKVLDAGKDAVLVINWEGFSKIKDAIQDNVIGVFINPPSLEELEARIRGRNTDSEETIQRRLSLAHNDIKHADIYDTCVTNHDIEDTALQIINYMKKVKSHEVD